MNAARLWLRYSAMPLRFTVLFVEDETPIRESVARLLTLRGFRVLTAENGYEALRILIQEHVDVLFTDIVMPGMNGAELARKAKRLRPTLKIMFVTGYPGKVPDALHLGRILYKPVRAREIDAELRTLAATP